MNFYFFVLALGLVCLTAVPVSQTNEKGSKDVIQVQVTGMLSGPPIEVGDAKEPTYAGSVFAGGRELFLDCAGNKAAKELLGKAYADLRKHTGYIPNKNVQVTGLLQFRPYLLYDDKGQQIEHKGTLAVIVVEALRVVE